MKRAIEFEQTVSFKHRVVVDCDEDAVEQICNLSGDSFGDIMYEIDLMEDVKVLECSENFSEDTDDDVGYYDDYWTKDEIKQYGDSE